MAPLWLSLVLVQYVLIRATFEADCETTACSSNMLVQLRAKVARRQEAIDVVHVLSMGREASCFVLDLVAGNGSHPTIFEPLGGVVEGEGIITMSARQTDSVLQCLYDCHNCTGNVVNRDSYSNLQSYCEELDQTSDTVPYLVVKTTRIVDHGALVRAVPAEYLATSRFIVLLRDPRGVWASTKPFNGWAIHSIPLICELLALQALTLPELSLAVGRRLLISVYERWTLDTSRFGGEVARLVNEDMQAFRVLGQDGQRATDELLPPSWVADLSTDELTEIENDDNCRAYMQRVGYAAGSWNASEIKDQAGLVAALSPAEAAVLSKLRSKQSALQTIAPRQRIRSCSVRCKAVVFERWRENMEKGSFQIIGPGDKPVGRAETRLHTCHDHDESEGVRAFVKLPRYVRSSEKFNTISASSQIFSFSSGQS